MKTPGRSLEIQHLTVDYGSQIGIEDVSLRFLPGEIHAVVGDHGAGKSTLVRAIAGNLRPARGRMILDGRPLDTRSPNRVLEQGILTIYQEIQIIPALSAYENMFLNREPRKRFGFRDHCAMRELLQESFGMLGLDIDIDKPMVYCRSNQKQLVDFARVLCFPAGLVMIDELSTKLAPVEMERIHQLLHLLRNRGVTIIYVSHDMREVVEFASTVTILKRGRVVETKSIGNTNELELIRLTYSSLYSRRDIENQNLELFQGKRLHVGVMRSLPVPIIVLDTRFRPTAVTHAAGKALDIPPVHDDSALPAFWEILSVAHDEAQRIRRVLTRSPSGTVEIHLPRRTPVPIRFQRIFEGDTYLGTMLMIGTSEPPMEFGEGSDALSVRTLVHEAINPLTISLNHLELAQGESSPDKMRQHIGSVSGEIRRAARLLQRFLRKNEFDNTSKEKPEVCRFSDILEELRFFLTNKLRQAGVEFDFDGSSGTHIAMSADQIKTIIFNLILNSMEAMPRGGRIRMRWTVEDGTAAVEFSDNGPGVEPSVEAGLFDPFVTTRAAGENDEPRGIGLSLCRGIIEDAGGAIVHRPEKKPGAHFELRLPAQV